MLAVLRYGFALTKLGDLWSWFLPLAGLQCVATIGAVEGRRSRRALLAAACLVYLLFFIGVVPGFAAPASVLPQVSLSALMALSLWIPFSSGQLSLAQAGFMAIGAYTASWLTVSAGWPTEPALAVGAATAALIGLAVSYPALRLRGIYLAIATLGFGEVVRIFFINFQPTGGAFGFSGMERTTQSWQILLVIFVTAVLLRNLMRGRMGRAIGAVKVDEITAAAMGIERTRVRIMTFTLGAFLAGLGGGLYAHYIQFIAPDDFGLASLIDWLTMLVFGGLQSFVGPLVGALVLGTLPELLHFLADDRLLINGLILVAVLACRPQGLITRDLVTAQGRRTGRPSAAVPPAPSTGAVAARESRELLRLETVGKRFGGLTALAEIDFTIRCGELVGVIGPNGSGKSTLFNLVSGIYAPDQGAIIFDGEPIQQVRPALIARRGLARTFQNIRLLPEMSLLENVQLGFHTQTSAGALRCALALDRAEERRCREEALALLDLVGLAGRAEDVPDSLSYGDRRRLEIARALALQPRLLLLDEPAAGMNPSETEALANLIRRMNRELGITIVLIEHDMDLIMTLCERVLVLNYGRVIAEGRPHEIQAHPAVVEAYLGRGGGAAAGLPDADARGQGE